MPRLGISYIIHRSRRDTPNHSRSDARNCGERLLTNCKLGKRCVDNICMMCYNSYRNPFTGPLRSFGDLVLRRPIYFESDGSSLLERARTKGGEPLIIYVRKTNTSTTCDCVGSLSSRSPGSSENPRRLPCCTHDKLIGGSWLRSTARRALGLPQKSKYKHFLWRKNEKHVC